MQFSIPVNKKHSRPGATTDFSSTAKIKPGNYQENSNTISVKQKNRQDLKNPPVRTELKRLSPEHSFS